MADADLTAHTLRELLSYDPETGLFTARIDFTGKGCKRRAGDLVGSQHNKGYWHIRIGARRYLAHRLAWLYMTGEWPSGVIDHINGRKSDNRWGNLRDVSQCINMQNRSTAMRSSKSGRLGVSWSSKDQRWVAQISANGKKQHIGQFVSKDLAEAAYLAAKAELHHAALSGR